MCPFLPAPENCLAPSEKKVNWVISCSTAHLSVSPWDAKGCSLQKQVLLVIRSCISMARLSQTINQHLDIIVIQNPCEFSMILSSISYYILSSCLLRLHLSCTVSLTLSNFSHLGSLMCTGQIFCRLSHS